MSDMIFLGGLDGSHYVEDNPNLSRTYSLGYRVYDSIGIAVPITSQGGGPGGSSGLYLVREKVDE